MSLATLYKPGFLSLPNALYNFGFLNVPGALCTLGLLEIIGTPIIFWIALGSLARYHYLDCFGFLALLPSSGCLRTFSTLYLVGYLWVNGNTRHFWVAVFAWVVVSGPADQRVSFVHNGWLRDTPLAGFGHRLGSIVSTWCFDNRNGPCIVYRQKS